MHTSKTVVRRKGVVEVSIEINSNDRGAAERLNARIRQLLDGDLRVLFPFTDAEKKKKPCGCNDDEF